MWYVTNMTLQFDVLFLPCRYLEPKGNTSGKASSSLRPGGYPADVLTGAVTADKGQALTCLQVSVLNAPTTPLPPPLNPQLANCLHLRLIMTCIEKPLSASYGWSPCCRAWDTRPSTILEASHRSVCCLSHSSARTW